MRVGSVYPVDMAQYSLQGAQANESTGVAKIAGAGLSSHHKL